RPTQEDKPGLDFDVIGHLNITVLKGIGVPRDADFYLCGPTAFMQDLTQELTDWGITREHIHAELFGPAAASTPGVVDASRQPPHPPTGSTGAGPLVSFARSALSVPWDTKFQSLLELAEACDISV